MALHIRYESTRLQVVRNDEGNPLLVQHARPGGRPYIHPIRVPDGKGVLTENEPQHHLWQHGLYTGLHGVNEWDFWTEGLSGRGLEGDGIFAPQALAAPEVDANTVHWTVSCAWQTTAKQNLLTETQSWTLHDHGEYFLLDLTWSLTAAVDISFAQCAYGGLFLRMPYRTELGATALDSQGRGRDDAEGNRSRWVAVHMPLEGRDGPAGIGVLDHPDNPAHPVPWRVDGQFGISPSKCIVGGWSLPQGDTATERYRLCIFPGEIDPDFVNRQWQHFADTKGA